MSPLQTAWPLAMRLPSLGSALTAFYGQTFTLPDVLVKSQVGFLADSFCLVLHLKTPLARSHGFFCTVMGPSGALSRDSRLTQLLREPIIAHSCDLYIEAQGRC